MIGSKGEFILLMTRTCLLFRKLVVAKLKSATKLNITRYHRDTKTWRIKMKTKDRCRRSVVMGACLASFSRVQDDAYNTHSIYDISIFKNL